MEFGSYDTEAAQLAAELANHWPEDTDDEGLRAWLARYRPAVRAARADLAAIRALGRRLWEIFACDDPLEVSRRVNELLDEANVRPQLSAHDGLRPHLHYAPPDAPVLVWLEAVAAMGLAELIAAEGVERLGVCAAHDCEEPFVDSSRNRSRRYCGVTCATREKVAAYRARQRESEDRTGD